MKHRTVSKLVGIALASTVALGALAGCATAQQSPEEQQQAANRQYMSQVNQVMDDLASRLEEFSSAVASSDAVSMRTHADSAYRVIDSLEELEAPEALQDIKTAYVESCAILEDALNSYITLYSEADTLDAATYEQRLAEVQARYDEGVAKMKEADELAAGKE